MKSLVVDDNMLNLKVTKRLLEQLGLEVDTVLSGYEAIARCKEIHYDIIFMDIFMPNMDGIETFNKLREDNVTCPIIALTADAESGAKEKYLNLGFNGYIEKPINFKLLTEIVNKYK